MSGPLILLSNDDGYRARGLRTLRDALEPLVGETGARLVIVAPAQQQSAKSHSLTLHHPLRYRTLEPDVHAVGGSPADCIYAALFHPTMLPRRPDLVVSGINHGYNLGSDVHYSGTVAAAREAALRGIDAIAFSLGPAGDFTLAAGVAEKIVRAMLEAPGRAGADERGHGRLLNVNFPPGGAPYGGLRATRLGRRIYPDEMVVRNDPRGREYFWIGGPGADHEPMPGSDTEAVDERWVSVTPLLLDATDPDGLGTAAWLAEAAAGGPERAD